jgi:ribosomal protein S27E
VVRARAEAGAGLPRRVCNEVERYLGCGDLRRGFVQVKCGDCRRTELVALSCKQRGLCPSCGTRRSHQTAAACGALLPEVAYRQWTLSAPYRARWTLVKQPLLLAKLERRLLRGVWAWQRRRAKGLGAGGGELRGGGVGFWQYFGSALQVTPHVHLLVPEAVWTDDAERVEVPGPDAGEVERILRRVVKGLAKDFAEVGESWPEDALDALRLEGVQHRLPLGEQPRPKRPGRRVAVVEGFSLHADTWVHGHDRQGLERLCRYGSRPPLALERLCRREDGQYEYHTRRGQALVLTAEQLVKRLVALLPPKGVHLTRHHGVFAPNAKLRPQVVRAAQLEPSPPAAAPGTGAGCVKEGTPPRRPRLDWASLQRRTFDADVWRCPCGGRRRVLAVITSRRTAEEVLANLGLLPRRASPPQAQSPPQLALPL